MSVKTEFVIVALNKKKMYCIALDVTAIVYVYCVASVNAVTCTAERRNLLNLGISGIFIR